MPRLYRVRILNRHGESVTISHAIPSDVADGMVEWLSEPETMQEFGWSRVWIETESGEVVYEVTDRVV